MQSHVHVCFVAEWMTIMGVSALPKEQLQNLIFQEMLHYHPEAIHLQWGAAPVQ
jgi:hypothetical protein